MMPTLFTPSRLTLARRRRGKTKGQLADDVRLSMRMIVNYESGRVTPPDERIEDFSRALSFPVSFFCRPEIEALDQTGVSFRSLARMKASQRDRALAAAELALELGIWLRDRGRFELPQADVPDLASLRDPEAAANTLRGIWNLGDKPIPHVVRLLEAKGVRVFSLAEEHDSLDGFSFWRDGTPYIFLNVMKSGERSRFDAAHELAHLVLHRHGSRSGRDAEHEAHAFASSFLMPRTSITAFAPRVASLDRLIEAKKGWGVSLAALAYRMHQIGMISDWQYRSLCIEITKRHLRNAEPQPVAREQSLVFEKVFSALRDDDMTKRTVAKELSWPLAELNALVFGLVLSSAGGSLAGELDEAGEVIRGNTSPSRLNLMR